MNNTQKFATQDQLTFSMRVKAVIATLLMLVFYVNSWASTVEPFDAGTQLFVTAQSGLHLRTSPDVHARSVKVIYMGEQVEVLEQPDSMTTTQKIDWVAGQWILVEHDGDQGYIFDGYLSPFTVPTHDWEKCQVDLDMIYPLEQWANANHLLSSIDTSESTHITRVTEHYTNGLKLVRTNSGDIYKVELYLPTARMMDAYHLLQTMLDDEPQLRTFQNESIFIEQADSDDLRRIKVKLDNPVDIRKLSNGTVKISIHSQEYPCQL